MTPQLLGACRFVLPFALAVTLAAPASAQVYDITAYGAIPNDGLDDSAAIQRAIDAAAGQRVVAPPGLFRVDNTLTYSIPGHGQSLRLEGAGMYATIFDNRVVNGPMIAVTTSLSSRFGFNGKLSNFAITTTTVPPGSDGLYLKKQYFLSIDHIRIEGLSGDAIRFNNRLGDPDTTAYLTIEDSLINGNGGFGIDTEGASAAIVGSELHRVQISQNAAGGGRLSGRSVILDSTSWYNNGGMGGLLLKSVRGSANYLWSIRNSNFENNTYRQLTIENMVGSVIEGNRFADTEDTHPIDTYMVELGNNAPAGGLRNVVFMGNFIKADTTVTPLTAIHVASDALYTKLANTSWQNFDGPGRTRILDNSTSSAIEDDNRARPPGAQAAVMPGESAPR